MFYNGIPEKIPADGIGIRTQSEKKRTYIKGRKTEKNPVFGSSCRDGTPPGISGPAGRT